MAIFEVHPDLARTASALERIADALERISPPPSLEKPKPIEFLNISPEFIAESEEEEERQQWVEQASRAEQTSRE